jgi:hypothetical protein
VTTTAWVVVELAVPVKTVSTHPINLAVVMVLLQLLLDPLSFAVAVAVAVLMVAVITAAPAEPAAAVMAQTAITPQVRE